MDSGTRELGSSDVYLPIEILGVCICGGELQSHGHGTKVLIPLRTSFRIYSRYHSQHRVHVGGLFRG